MSESVKEAVRGLLVVAFLVAGIILFNLGKDAPGYVLLGAAANAFPGLMALGNHKSGNDKDGAGKENGKVLKLPDIK